MSNGNGFRRLYELALTDRLTEQIGELRGQAVAAGRGEEFDAALRTIQQRLRTDPLGFGTFRRLNRFPLIDLREGVVKPLLVRYGVARDRPLVLVEEFVLLGEP